MAAGNPLRVWIPVDGPAEHALVARLLTPPVAAETSGAADFRLKLPAGLDLAREEYRFRSVLAHAVSKHMP